MYSGLYFTRVVEDDGDYEEDRDYIIPDGDDPLIPAIVIEELSEDPQ